MDEKNGVFPMKKKSAKKLSMKFSTKVIHVGGEPDALTGAVMAPIYQTSTYAQKSPGVHQGYDYTRSHNPTRTRLEECLASLEKATYAIATSSGMAATSLIMHHLPPKSVILSGNDVYGGTYRLFTTVFQKTHKFHFIDTTDFKNVEKAIKTYKPQALWIETPSNPLFKLSDLKALGTLAKKNKILFVVDNTFMSPYFQNPLELGADIVLHSATKYLNGHSDVVAGCLMLNNKKIYEDLFRLHNSIGPCQSPFDSWLVLRGLKTLAVRMREHEKNALAVAEFLEAHPKVEKVLYPGLSSHPQHKLAKKQMKGFGGTLTFFLKGGIEESRRFLEALQVFTLAESLGGVESLADHPALMTHASIPEKVRLSLGLTNNLIRLSVGIEDVRDLVEDLKQALKNI